MRIIKKMSKGALSSLEKGSGLRKQYSPWTCREEWELVYTWLYSSRPQLIRKGVNRVAAWKSRGGVPMMVEMTANLCECRVQEKMEGGGVHFQALILQYSIAVTRFINGIADIVKERLNLSADLRTCVHEYGIPSWVVILRHTGTHEKLPSIGALRAGAEFCLNWLRANYWRPQRLTIGHSISRSATPTELVDRDDEEVRKEPRDKDTSISRLSRGLCRSRDQLMEVLTQSDYKQLSDYLKCKHLLHFPRNVKYEVKVPSEQEMAMLPSLQIGEGDMGMWRTHLLKTSKQSDSFKQRLVSALICTINDSNCAAGMRDFLAGWLNLLISSDQVETVGDMEIVHILDDEDIFLPGDLDWLELLHVAKHHVGHYLLAVVNVITRHLKSVASESTLSNILYLSAQVTISARVGSASYIPNYAHKKGNHLRQFKEMISCVLLTKKENTVSKLGDNRMEEEVRWKPVSDMTAWVHCPMGMCPGQTIQACMFDLPKDSLRNYDCEETTSDSEEVLVTDDGISTTLEKEPFNSGSSTTCTSEKESFNLGIPELKLKYWSMDSSQIQKLQLSVGIL